MSLSLFHEGSAQDIHCRQKPKNRQKQKIASAFGRAAARYDSLANYQQNTGSQLLRLLDQYANPASLSTCHHILDAGCGTGFFSQIMQQRGDQVTALDLSVGMLNVAKSKQSANDYVCADMDALPFDNASFDGVFSNLAIQWCDDLQHALGELYRVTKPGGMIGFTTLAENSLGELSQAWKVLDDTPHVNRFLAYPQITKSCLPWRHQLFQQADTLYFSNLIELLNSVKGIGATHLTAGRQSGLMTRQRLQQLISVYPDTDQGLPLTYQTVFGIIYRD
ncbi:malonyl-ACP O-methyltransferase BioC [Providencia rustigianii]|uniref:malonyl-ACP O-methyltransferase BioC n=1 Tax=Providencia rustigianii TaxID=158850 RepID=UPI0035E67BFA